MASWSRPLVLALLVTVLAWRCQWLHALTKAELLALASLLATIGATLLGFVLAALALLAALVDTSLLRNMQRTGHYPLLLQRMLAAAAACGLLTALAVSTAFFPDAGRSAAYALLLSSTLTSVLLGDIIRKFWLVLLHVGTSPS